MDYMEQALSLARLALGQVSPNPAVGAVVVKDDVVVGQGYTQPPGSWHAEVVALKQAGEEARGGVMYVTLEPCCYYGRTPPCSEAIIDAGITEVHLAMLDPNPLVSGRGKDELERNGIKAYVGEREAEAREVNEAYTKFITTGIPFITAKFAISLDGKIATKSGDSRWISGEEARKYVHNLRYTTDAIMAGVNTVLADDPCLTTRCGGKGGTARKQPLRVIVDSKGRTPPTARVFSEPGKTLLAVGRLVKPEGATALAQVGAELLELPSADGLVDLEKLLIALGERGITSVLVEGGGILLGSLFDYRLVDKVIIFISPIIIGGEGAKTAVAGKGVDKVVNSFKLERSKVEKLGEDLMVSGYIRG
ncbi:MAG TPA: bifunctional diaminohydroxyphosphoribosylaminopyrimidine deaminase/5-amino-6-(5-phosphoribosylamino)uracil reductase RibD [Dehalococcoidia bacterium]|jgi:diaminohydroxyphosphoribosylaminopyrimidine deaminase/5-amino-6-(5-phosphoribosylamino)uracil reductase|nr:bifunctional diaminohydroxyphosphoribosylaminopyrimidine deaminase/5-amino-6-(5-phosphoribosylamino)uracil reductase RibD [Dehalococcoidia bacterium]